jgi:hypothetical protein
MTRHILAAITVAMLASGHARDAGAQQQPGDAPSHTHQGHEAQAAMGVPPAHDHGPAVPAISYAELQRTTEQLAAARQATTKYQNVRVAEADGYHAIGPDVPGMGLHYVRERQQETFSIAEPPILLYERDADARGGLRLVGVSYLLVAPSGPDEQPDHAPFPKALARWHKHNNVCVLPDHDATISLNETQCTAQGGHFTSETSWMVHAWIWKDSPTGVFSPTNPLVK